MPSKILVLIAFSAVLDGILVAFKPGDQIVPTLYKSFLPVWDQHGSAGTGYLIDYTSPIGSRSTNALTAVMVERAKGYDEKDLSLQLQTAVILDLL